MNLPELKEIIQKYQYMEDTKVIDVAVASVIATRLKLGDPLWLIIIGASSGGKSQILRPVAKTDEKFIQQVDDMTENTLLSGMKSKSGEKNSLLDRMGNLGMFAISDLTVLFSKNSESRATILSQFRMLYDGKMTKHSGSLAKPLTWEGHLGVISGSTPSIYSIFEEVSDMGERFIYYRMKEYDGKKATRLALGRKLFGSDLDTELSEAYGDYIKGVVRENADKPVELSEEVVERIIEISDFAERVRTMSHYDKYTKETSRKPISAMPTRTALQLNTLAKALTVMEKSDPEIMEILDWCGWSLANEEKRECLGILSKVDFEHSLNTSSVADKIGLSTSVIGLVLQNLASVGVLDRGAGNSGLSWSFKSRSDYEIVRRVLSVKGIEEVEDREVTVEETEELDKIVDQAWGE